MNHKKEPSFKNQNLNVELRVDDLLDRLTRDEKFKLLAGNRYFQTHSIKRLGVKPFKMTDGPLGISRHSSFFRKNTKFPGGICNILIGSSSRSIHLVEKIIISD